VSLVFTVAITSLAAIAFPVVASASQDHAYSTSFGTSGTGAGQMSLITPNYDNYPHFGGSGVAVNYSTGDVYVADTANRRVDQFSSAGAFIRAWGWGVANGAVELQSCTATCQAGLSGSEPGQFEIPTFVAIDNAPGGEGDVYVADNGSYSIQKFTATGVLIESWGVKGQKFPNLPRAVGTGTTTAGSTEITSATGAFEAGNLIFGPGIPPGDYVQERAGETVILAQPASASAAGVPLITRTTGDQIAGIAVDSSGGLWAYDESSRAYKFDREGGSLLTTWGPSGEGRTSGIAVDSVQNLYATPNQPQNIQKFSSTGDFLGLVYSAPVTPVSAFAIDPTTNDLYVDERSAIQDISGQCEASSRGCASTQTFGAPQLHEAAGLTLTPDGTLYAANTSANQIAVFTPSLEATTAAATEVKATFAMLNAKVDPKGTPITKCFFQLGETGKTLTYGRNFPCLNPSGEEVGTPGRPITSAVQVHSKVSSLRGGTNYHFRLFAANSSAETIHSEDELLETLVLPVISEASTKEITESSATLVGKVNPEGLAATCQIEWGDSTSYGTTIPCPAGLGSGTSPVPITAQLTGLTANTTYHWRIVATDVNGTETGSDNTFVYLTISPGSLSGSCAQNEALREVNGSTALPDCRAYEQITPNHKNGATINRLFLGPHTVIATDGSRVISPSLQCFNGSQSCIGSRQEEGAPFEFTRTASGWTTSALAPPASIFSTSSEIEYHPNTGKVLFGIPTPNLEEFFVRQPNGQFEAIGPTSSQRETRAFAHDPFIYTTPDLSHLLFNRERGLWPFDAGSGLYEYVGTGNEKPLLVAVEGPEGSISLVGNCLISRKNDLEGSSLSADGRTVYFVSSCTGHLYARIDGELPSARTVDISERSPTDCTGACSASASSEARFQGAAADGATVYFTSSQQLTNSAAQGSHNLYLYKDPQDEPLVGNHLTDVSAGDTSGIGPDVEGVMAISPDGSHVYFVAGGTLTGANAEGKEPVEGAANLYDYQRDSANPSGKLSFIATLSSENFGRGGTDDRQWTGGIGFANVTPDGNFLVFTSHAALTPDVTRRVGPAQIYRYDAQAEALNRVSIGRRGFNDNGNVGSGEATIVLAAESLNERRANPTLSSDGSRVFFESPNGLTPNALDDVETNNRGDLAENVYEWEEDGRGDCVEKDGCVYLISDGRDATEGPNGTASSVELLGTDSSGEDVFFATADQLTPTDTDSGQDYYDARVGGGFPKASEPSICQGDACKGPGTQAGPERSPGTQIFNGPEEGAQHPQQQKKAHKHKHHKRKASKKSHKRAAGHNRGGE